MQRTTVVIALVASVGLAWFTSDWESPPQRRVHAQGRRFVSQRAAPPADPGVEEPVAAPDPAVEPVEPEQPVEPTPAPEPKPEPKVELKTIEDVTLCVAENAQDPTFQRSCEIHIDSEGERTWHAGGKSVELGSLKAVVQGLEKRFQIPDVVWVPDEWTTWQQVFDVTRAAQAKDRSRFWIGVAKPGDPKTLRVLSFFQEPTATPEVPEGEVFEIYVKEVKDQMHLEVNGTVIEDFPAGFALAWNEWKAAHPNIDTSTPYETPVVLAPHRFTPCKMVVSVLDVMRGLGIQCQALGGDMGQRRRR